MSAINYGQLAGEPTHAPPDGLHDAYLMGARLQIGSRDFVVTEWQAGDSYWESLNGFEGARMRFTQDLLDGLGIDRRKATSDAALEAALADCRGSVYRVRVERNGSFVNTYVEGGVSTQAMSDIPADTSGLPDVSDEPLPWDQPRAPAQAALTREPVATPAATGSPPVDLTDDELNDIFQ